MKRKIIIIAIIVMTVIAITMIYQTFAISSNVSVNNNTYNFTLNGTSEISVPASSSKTVIYQITNTNKGVVQYGVAYKGDNIIVKVYNTSEDTATGTIDYGENKFVKLSIMNTGTTDSVATIDAVLGYEHGGDLILPSGYSWVTLKVYDCSVYDTAVECISTMYLENPKENVNFKYSSDYYENANLATSVSLINDRLGLISEDYDEGNIRYFGVSSNNYVDIGDRDSSGNIILYRIVGLFKDIKLENGTTQDLIKVVRDESIGYYTWDSKSNGIGSSISDSGSSDWTDARLMMLLNPGYDSYSEETPLLDDSGDVVYGYEGSLWWNSKGGTCYVGRVNRTEPCDFSSTGLSSGVHNKIETVIWNLGGVVSGANSSTFYSSERGSNVYDGRPTEWTGKIGLLYASDFVYMSEPLWFNVGRYWTLTSMADSSNNIITASVSQAGNRAFEATLLDTANILLARYHVHPAFYLKSELAIKSGCGTSTDPYVIG